MSDKECSGDSCGYYRPDTVAYRKFTESDVQTLS